MKSFQRILSRCFCFLHFYSKVLALIPLSSHRQQSCTLRPIPSSSSNTIKASTTAVNYEDESSASSQFNQSALDKNSSFRDYALPSWLIDRCETLGFKGPTEVQSMGLPLILEGKDVILQAQTGSGKTLLYALPVLANIDPTRAAIQAVIIVPTRELGMQVASVLKSLSSSYNKLKVPSENNGVPGASGDHNKISIMSIVEGSNNRRQQIWATAEPPHIIIGNPKALQRVVDMGRLRLNSVSMVVIDEVDACLLHIDTKKDLHKLLSRRLSTTYQTVDDLLDAENEGMTSTTSKMTENLVYTDLTKKNLRMNKNLAETNYRNTRQTIFCSATIPQRQHFVQLAFKNGWTQSLAELVHVTPTQFTPFQIAHELIDYVTVPTPTVPASTVALSTDATDDNTTTKKEMNTKSSKRSNINRDSDEGDSDNNEDAEEQKEEGDDDNAMSTTRRAEQESRKRAYLRYIIKEEVKVPTTSAVIKSAAVTTTAATKSSTAKISPISSKSPISTEKATAFPPPQQQPQVIVFVENADEAYRVCNFLIDSIPSLFPSSSSSPSITTSTASIKTVANTIASPVNHNTDSRRMATSRNRDDKTNTRLPPTIVPTVSTISMPTTSAPLRAMLRKKRGLPISSESISSSSSSNNVIDNLKKDDDDDEEEDEENTNNKNNNKSSNNGNNVNKNNNNDGDSVLVMRLDETMNIDQRAVALEQYRKGACRILVCTDLTARGIDVPETTLVIQWSVPKTHEQYLHRAGRTGRLGRVGRVVTFITADQEFVMKRFANELNIDLKKRNLKLVVKSNSNNKS